MSGRKRTKGKCIFCGKKMTGGGLSKHLKACEVREKAIEEANANNSKAPEQRLFHLHIKNAHTSDFWLHLELNGNSSLKELDEYLRSIWLECCGHMSHFTKGNNPWGDEVSMNRKVFQLLEPDMELTHVYDFGSSTETSVKVVDTRTGKPMTNYPIFLMARNEMPDVSCEKCNNKAKWLHDDFESYDGPEFLCEKHKKEALMNNEINGELLELVNSPRLGVCGYTGPAKTPYSNARTFWLKSPIKPKKKAQKKPTPKGQQSLFDQ